MTKMKWLEVAIVLAIGLYLGVCAYYALHCDGTMVRTLFGYECLVR